MEPWLEVVVVSDGSPKLGLGKKLLAEEGCPPPKKRPCRPQPRTEAPKELKPLKPAGGDPPAPSSAPGYPCSAPPGDWATDCWDPVHEWPKERAGPRKLPNKSSPALGAPPSPAPRSNPAQPARRSAPVSSGSRRPAGGDLARQRPPKPAQSKRPKSGGNEGAAAIALLVRGVLSAFPSGLRLAKLLEIMKRRHGVTVETLSQAAGAADVLKFMAQVPGLRLRTPKRGLQCLIQLQTELTNESAAAPKPPPSPAPHSSLSQPAQRPAPVSACCCCCPETGDLELQQPEKPAPLKRSKSTGNRDAAGTLAPLLQQVLRPFPMGLGLPRLLDTVWRDHGLDLLALSHEAEDGNVLRLLGQVPGIQLHQPSGHSKGTVILPTAMKPPSC
ncbi:RNA exonuclease 1 homolog isoform X2 [Emydura macquarii macquarii]|uniref:RNA exonuclease 1 homolog isoform X2 n=1 Tax=Emydura macquarii macquarii TaxID=1129001 RepID=UPI00352B50AD